MFDLLKIILIFALMVAGHTLDYHWLEQSGAIDTETYKERQ